MGWILRTYINPAGEASLQPIGSLFTPGVRRDLSPTVKRHHWELMGASVEYGGEVVTKEWGECIRCGERMRTNGSHQRFCAVWVPG